MTVNNRLNMDDVQYISWILLMINIILLFISVMMISFVTPINYAFNVLYLMLSISIFSIFSVIILTAYVKLHTIDFSPINEWAIIDEPFELITKKEKGIVTVEPFIVNEFITLKLINKHTTLYIKGKEFIHCMFLMINIQKGDIAVYDEVESIDDAKNILDDNIDDLDKSLENGLGIYNITPEEEFIGHCSNIQAWAENGYNTRILHSNISFPLLKELTRVGDKVAKGIFAEEIVSRFLEGNATVRTFLNEGFYLNYLSKDQLLFLVTELIEKENRIYIKADIRKTSTFTLVSYPDNYNVDDSNVLEVNHDENNNPVHRPFGEHLP